MENEIWVPVQGFEGHYEISNQGRVKSLPRIVFRRKCGYTPVHGRYIAFDLGSSKYPRAGLVDPITRKQIKFLVSRLVAKHFVPNPNNKKFVNHIDHNPMNNVYTNLEWVTCEENMQHCIHAGRFVSGFKGKRKIGIANHKSKRIVCLNNGKIYESQYLAANELGLRQSKISLVCSGKRNSTMGYKFEFLDKSA